MPYQYDILPYRRPDPWTKFQDYAVIDCIGNFTVCPEVFGLRHIGVSNVFDYRCGRDVLAGLDPEIRVRNRR